jgi:hypothetical protein
VSRRWFLVCIGCSGCCRSAVFPVQQSASAIAVTQQGGVLAPDVLEFHIEAADAENILRFRLRNRSDMPLWVNARMGISSRDAFAGELWLDVTHVKTGERLEQSCRAGRGDADVGEYAKLSPGSEIAVARSLHCFPFGDRGPWKIVAHYRDRNKNVPKGPVGARWFAGTLDSNELELNVLIPTTAGDVP